MVYTRIRCSVRLRRDSFSTFMLKKNLSERSRGTDSLVVVLGRASRDTTFALSKAIF